MSVYFFDTHMNDQFVIDDEGVQLSDNAHAREMAEIVLMELVRFERPGGTRNASIWVRDERGSSVCQLDLSIQRAG